MDEKQAVTFALFFYISESPKGHLNLQCTDTKIDDDDNVSNSNVYFRYDDSDDVDGNVD